MIRHISVFSFKNTPEKQKNLEEVKAFLEQVPDLYPPAKNQKLYLPAAPTPELPEDAPVLFGDLIQVVDFETLADTEGYPASEAHIKLADFSTPMMKKVTVIDYPVDGE